MSTVKSKIETSMHTSFICPMTGQGIMVAPNPHLVASLAGIDGDRMWQTDHDEMMRKLHAVDFEGYEEIEIEVGTTRSGRPMTSLYGRDPIMSDPEFSPEAVEAWAELLGLARAL